MELQSLAVKDVVVLADNSEAIITGIDKGWVHLNTEKSVRAKQVIEVVGHDDTDVEEDDDNYSMAHHLQRYREAYTTVKNASGGKSKICNDELSQMLSWSTPDFVVSIAEHVLGRSDIVDKYAGLNEGQKRMSAGNLIRNAMKRGDIVIDDVRKSAKAVGAILNDVAEG